MREALRKARGVKASPQKREPLLKLDEISRFDNLLLFSKSVVEGYYSGIHRATNYGSSAQFKDYRAYQPGDEISKIDWRLYGRSRRLSTRLYDNETDMVIYLLIDVSGSMGYGDDVQKNLARIAHCRSTFLFDDSSGR